jgi:hypothetical protein
MEGSAGQIGGQLPGAGIALYFLKSAILFQIWGRRGVFYFE